MNEPIEPHAVDPLTAAVSSPPTDRAASFDHVTKDRNVDLARSLARWQRFVAMIIVGLAILVLGNYVVVFATGEAAAIAPFLFSFAISATSVIVIYVLPSVFLWRAAGASRQFANQPNSNSWAQLIYQQAKFWQVTGIIVLVCFGMIIGLMGLMLLLTIVGFSSF